MLRSIGKVVRGNEEPARPAGRAEVSSGIDGLARRGSRRHASQVDWFIAWDKSAPVDASMPCFASLASTRRLFK